MTITRKTPAAEQFKALGVPPTGWTKAMKTAVKQKWAGLPVDLKVADLRDQIAAVAVEVPPSVDALVADAVCRGADHVTRDEAVAERARLLRNAKVTAWRHRTQLQAALDAREAKFAALRAKKGSATGAVRSTSGDLPAAAAS